MKRKMLDRTHAEVADSAAGAAASGEESPMSRARRFMAAEYAYRSGQVPSVKGLPERPPVNTSEEARQVFFHAAMWDAGLEAQCSECTDKMQDKVEEFKEYMRGMREHKQTCKAHLFKNSPKMPKDFTCMMCEEHTRLERVLAAVIDANAASADKGEAPCDAM